MYKILLCCTSGLTTSMLVDAMKKEADNQKIDVMIWTVGQNAVEMSWADADCLLVAPQNEVEYIKVKEVVNNVIPVSLIDSDDFAKMNGKAVLDYAIKLIDEARL